MGFPNVDFVVYWAKPKPLAATGGRTRIRWCWHLTPIDNNAARKRRLVKGGVFCYESMSMRCGVLDEEVAVVLDARRMAELSVDCLRH